MQLTVLCLLGVAGCAYAQIGAGFDISKNFNVSLPFVSFEISKGIGAGIDLGNNRRRREAPARDPPKGPRRLVGKRPEINSENGPEDEDLNEAGENGQGPSRPKFGFGPSRHPLPPRFPFPPKHRHHGRKSTTTESSVETSSSSSSEANDGASNENSSEASNDSSSQSNNEANNESNSNESSETSNEANNDASNESDSNSSNESSS